MAGKRTLMAMNNPYRSLESEITFILQLGFDEMELTIEPPEAYLDDIEKNISTLKRHCSIGHTRIDLEFANPDAALRQDAIAKYEASLDAFAEIGIHLVNFHPHKGDDKQSIDEVRILNIESLQQVCRLGNERGISIMIENQQPFPTADLYDNIFTQVPDARLLFDVAHAYYLGGHNNVMSFIANYANKIAHIHLCDNRGAQDDHLYLGKGSINFATYLAELLRSTDPSVAFSLEPFMVDDFPSGLRLASQQERNVLLQQSLELVRKCTIELP